MRAIIAGGGIGGLTLALMLHQRGFKATVFEQAESVRTLGVGINTLPHAIKELAELGLLPALDKLAIRTEELIYKTARGQEILRQKRGLHAGYDYPQFSIHRGMLQKAIYDACVAEMGCDAIITNHRLVDFAQTRSGVAATFVRRDGGPEETMLGDVLIGADGIHSNVRRKLHGDEGPPRWNGVMMWRGATWFKPFLTGRSMIIAGGMGAKLVLYPIHNHPDRPNETVMNWVICAKTGQDGDPSPKRDDWSRPGSASEVEPYIDGLFTLDEVNVRALVEATPEFYVYPMCDRDPLPSWSEGRVTLLGDAAHPMYPVGSNGASQAILDARRLADLLAEHRDNPAAAVAAYEADRRPTTSSIVKANRKGGPEQVIDLVEARAPDGFNDINDVASPDELRAIVGDYQQMAGFSTEQVNDPDSEQAPAAIAPPALKRSRTQAASA